MADSSAQVRLLWHAAMAVTSGGSSEPKSPRTTKDTDGEKKWFDRFFIFHFSISTSTWENRKTTPTFNYELISSSISHIIFFILSMENRWISVSRTAEHKIHHVNRLSTNGPWCCLLRRHKTQYKHKHRLLQYNCRSNKTQISRRHGRTLLLWVDKTTSSGVWKFLSFLVHK